MYSSKHLTIVVFLIIFHSPNSAHPGHATSDSTKRIEVLMPGLAPQVESNLCRSIKLNKSTNIVGFEPKARMPVVHHILLFGCQEPGSEEDVWSCGEMQHNHGDHHHHDDHDQHHHHDGHDHEPAEESFKPGSICKEGYEITILYAWAKNAPNLMLPEDVGFRVGPGSPIRYIILQAHYGDISSFVQSKSNRDYSGVVLLTKSKNIPKQAGVFLMVTGGVIPALSTTYLEAACEFKEPFPIYPFAFRTHTHSLGKVVSGYRVRGDKWTEIGRKDPQLPQMFYNVTTPGITIKPGDILASRCTMVNEQEEDVQIGTTAKDEMCNFYFMFYVEGNKTLKENICMTPGFPSFRWKDYLSTGAAKNIPSDASIVPGTDTILRESNDRLLDGDYNPKADSSKIFGVDDDEEEEELDGDYNAGNMHRMKNSYPRQLFLDNGYPLYEYQDEAKSGYADKENVVHLLKELSDDY